MPKKHVGKRSEGELRVAHDRNSTTASARICRALTVCFLLFFHLFLTPTRGSSWFPFSEKEFFQTHFRSWYKHFFFAVCSCSPSVSHCRSFSTTSHAPRWRKTVGRRYVAGANGWWREESIANIKRAPQSQLGRHRNRMCSSTVAGSWKTWRVEAKDCCYRHRRM